MNASPGGFGVALPSGDDISSTLIMKRLASLFCACFVTSLLLAVTPEQIAAWKLRFPVVSVAEPYDLRQLASTYENAVRAQ